MEVLEPYPAVWKEKGANKSTEIDQIYKYSHAKKKNGCYLVCNPLKKLSSAVSGLAVISLNDWITVWWSSCVAGHCFVQNKWGVRSVSVQYLHCDRNMNSVYLTYHTNNRYLRHERGVNFPQNTELWSVDVGQLICIFLLCVCCCGSLVLSSTEQVGVGD